MQVVVKTEYQDIYRITDGVLLVVNKFEYVQPYRYIYFGDAKTGKYNKNSQDHLKILKKDYFYNGVSYPKGTVIYGSHLVKLIYDKTKWQYQIKTTGESFSGNADEMTEMLNEIISVIRKE